MGECSNTSTDGGLISCSHFDSVRFLIADVTIQKLIIRVVHNETCTFSSHITSYKTGL